MQAWDRYAYVNNNPVRYTDPSGHWYYEPTCECLVDTHESYNEYPNNFSAYINPNTFDFTNIWVWASSPVPASSPSAQQATESSRGKARWSSPIAVHAELETPRVDLFYTYGWAEYQVNISTGDRQPIASVGNSYVSSGNVSITGDGASVTMNISSSSQYHQGSGTVRMGVNYELGPLGPEITFFAGVNTQANGTLRDTNVYSDSMSGVYVGFRPGVAAVIAVVVFFAPAIRLLDKAPAWGY